MLNFHLSYQWLRWRKPNSEPSPLPDNIKRTYIPTQNGDLELLSAIPSTPTSTTPIFFNHGGMGSAWVWIPYMKYLSSRGIPCYALSTRGHGESWHPGFFRMVYWTTKRDLADDVKAGIDYVQEKTGEEVVLCGHSSGGGLSQFILNEGDAKVKALVLVAAVPGYGSTGVYLNWWRLDPLFTIRLIFHLWHPNSPLSHPELTRRAFFSPEIPFPSVLEFQRHMNAYESFLWPFGMMRPFVTAKNVIRHITGWEADGADRVLVLAGGCDKLMTYDVKRKTASFYRDAVEELVEEKKLERKIDTEEQKLAGEGELDNSKNGVRFCSVPGAGHHLQNDVQWEVGARKLLEFYQQLW